MYQCKDITEEVNNYIEGDLPFAKRISLFFHFLICNCCRNYLQQIRSTISIVTTSQPKEQSGTDLKNLAQQLQETCQNHKHEH